MPAEQFYYKYSLHKRVLNTPQNIKPKSFQPYPSIK